MALRQIEYQGVIITAAAFEVAGTGRFLVTLSIAKGTGDGEQRDAELFDPPSHDGLFDSIEEALESAIAFGRSIVDSDNADEDPADP
jgi:hypothetical protein